MEPKTKNAAEGQQQFYCSAMLCHVNVENTGTSALPTSPGRRQNVSHLEKDCSLYEKFVYFDRKNESTEIMRNS
jgi:hypothetical protein